MEMKVEPEDELTDGEREELEREIDHDGGPREQGVSTHPHHLWLR